MEFVLNNLGLIIVSPGILFLAAWAWLNLKK